MISLGKHCPSTLVVFRNRGALMPSRVEGSCVRITDDVIQQLTVPSRVVWFDNVTWVWLHGSLHEPLQASAAAYGSCRSERP